MIYLKLVLISAVIGSLVQVNFCEVIKDEMVKDHVKEFLGLMPNLPLAVTSSNNSECLRESGLFLQSLKNYTLWAFESKYLT